MPKATDSRTQEEVIFERYWAHACAHCRGLKFVEVSSDGGYQLQPVDTNLLQKMERLLDGADPLRFRIEVQACVAAMIGGLKRMPTTREILDGVPGLGKIVKKYVRLAA